MVGIYRDNAQSCCHIPVLTQFVANRRIEVDYGADRMLIGSWRRVMSAWKRMFHNSGAVYGTTRPGAYGVFTIYTDARELT